MVSCAGFLFVLALGLCVFATPLIKQSSSPVTLSIAKRIKAVGPLGLLLHDQARARGLIAQAARASGKHDSQFLSRQDFPFPIPATNATNSVFDYTTTVRLGHGLLVAIAFLIISRQVTIGDPGTPCKILSTLA